MSEETVNQKWQPAFVGPVCIGIEAVISEHDGGTYSKVILNSILPDTDEEYEEQKVEIEGVVNLICKLYNEHLKNKS